MTELAGKTCTPCRSGVPPLDRAAAERYLREAPGWALMDEGKRIERKFQLRNFKEALALVNRPARERRHHGHQDQPHGRRLTSARPIAPEDARLGAGRSRLTPR